MAKLTPYLFFAGNCREAMEFYKQTFAGNLEVMKYGDHDDSCGEAMKEQVMHAALVNGDLELFASDSPKGETTVGSNVQIAVSFDAPDQVNTIFEKLTESGSALAEPHDAFWGDRFAAVKDQYGVQWMLTAPLK